MKLLLLLGFVAVVSCQHHTQSPDHLLSVLQAIHNSHSFHALPQSEKILLIELMAAAEVDQVTHYIDRVGMQRILDFLDHVNKISEREAHLLEQLLVKELYQETSVAPAVTQMTSMLGKRADLHNILHQLQSNAAFTQLSAEDQKLMTDLITAANSGNVTQLIHQVGYARVIALVEDISTPTETHRFLSYLVQHMEHESQHMHPQPVG